METPSKVFLRKASGLIREISFTDVLLYNIAQISIGIGIAYIVLFDPSFYPGSSMELSILITTIGCMFFAMVYALFSVTMPRSGGDYVFVTRTLHPAIGFAMNWNFAVWELFYVGWSAGLFGFLGLSEFFAILGSITGNPQMATYAAFAASPNGYVIVGTIAIIFFTVLLVFGVRTYFKFQAASFIIAFVGSVLTIFVLATSNTTSFITAFNNYASLLGVSSKDAYHDVINEAVKAGYAAGAPFSWDATLKSTLWPFLALAISMLSTVFAGEIKGVKKNQMIGIPASLLLCGGLFIVMAYLMVNVVGYNFLGAVAYLYYVQPSAYPLPTMPWYSLFASLLSSNVVVTLLILVSFAIWSVYWVGVCAIYSSRSMLAWSFDRLTPKWLGYVSERYRTPVAAVLLSMGIGWVFLIIYAYTPYLVTLVGMLGLAITILIVCIAGFVLPFRRKELFEKSPANYRVAGVPVISILSLGGIIYLLYTIYLFLIDSVVAANTPSNEIAIVGIIISGFVYFYAARAYQKRKGIDVDLAYKEVPIE
ncbi:MAG: amino acid permease [Candidatus Bathyarchaeia archaeon]